VEALLLGVGAALFLAGVVRGINRSGKPMDPLTVGLFVGGLVLLFYSALLA